MRCKAVRIIVCRTETKYVKWVFNEYLSGSNLKEIAEFLTKRRVEYLPGEYGWNKNRIKRMIEDNRYVGDDTYPAIISEDIFQKANAEKNSRRTYTVPTVTAENKQLVSVVICGECGGRLFHRTDNAHKHSETWYCKSDDCKTGIPMSIAELEIEIISILNQLIDNPFLAEQTKPEMTIEPSLELQRMENELERKFESLDFDKNDIQYMILQCAAKKYDEHKSARHITDRLESGL